MYIPTVIYGLPYLPYTKEKLFAKLMAKKSLLLPLTIFFLIVERVTSVHEIFY